MDKNDILLIIDSLEEKLKRIGKNLNLEVKEGRINEIETKLNEENIWQQPEIIKRLNSELVNLKKQVNSFQNMKNVLTEYQEILVVTDDEEIVNEIEKKIEEITKQIEELELETLLSGKYDRLNCYLEIHPGAGGTEACDWAAMLARMYQMFCNKYAFCYDILDSQVGDEAGIKSIIMKISGNCPYGYFKGEQGVHRLVRISPFDSNARRHTSFAAVSVIPEIGKAINVEIKPEEIRVDVYRSSGKGGQGVNTTDSAVRITHLPTNIVVTCQNERSQIQNKEVAMNILLSKLTQRANEEQKSSINNLKNNKNIEFGNQIRSYTLEPYKLVKDMRTGYETANADAVLNGDLLGFMNEYLKRK